MYRSLRIILCFQLIYLVILGAAVQANQDERKTNLLEKDQPSVLIEPDTKILNDYMIDIARSIQETWVQKTKLISKDKWNPNAVTEGIFKVLPNGRIIEILITGESGDNAFDELNYYTVAATSPVKPHPKELSRPFIQMGIRFSAKGVK